jgi:hypothetical protein
MGDVIRFLHGAEDRYLIGEEVDVYVENESVLVATRGKRNGDVDALERGLFPRGVPLSGTDDGEIRDPPLCVFLNVKNVSTCTHNALFPTLLRLAVPARKRPRGRPHPLEEPHGSWL